MSVRVPGARRVVEVEGFGLLLVDTRGGGVGTSGVRPGRQVGGLGRRPIRRTTDVNRESGESPLGRRTTLELVQGRGGTQGLK